MKTPEEIKKGLYCCTNDEDGCNCEHCPYNLGLLESGCIAMFAADALAYIQQLERERDAAVRDLEANKRCETCMYYTPGYFCLGCRNGSEWQWRGVEGVRK